jgi:hypothetical protein
VTTYPALHGFIQQIPDGWTVERRQAWLDAFVLVLDFSVPVVPPVDAVTLMDSLRADRP